VVVSYYDHPELDRLYAGWSKRRIEVSKATAHQGRRGENAAKAMEVLLTNERMSGQGVPYTLFS
jgi:hypothetical protein